MPSGKLDHDTHRLSERPWAAFSNKKKWQNVFIQNTTKRNTICSGIKSTYFLRGRTQTINRFAYSPTLPYRFNKISRTHTDTHRQIGYNFHSVEERETNEKKWNFIVIKAIVGACLCNNAIWNIIPLYYTLIWRNSFTNLVKLLFQMAFYRCRQTWTHSIFISSINFQRTLTPRGRVIISKHLIHKICAYSIHSFINSENI